jgi:hypothetical protein
MAACDMGLIDTRVFSGSGGGPEDLSHGLTASLAGLRVAAEAIALR